MDESLVKKWEELCLTQDDFVAPLITSSAKQEPLPELQRAREERLATRWEGITSAQDNWVVGLISKNKRLQILNPNGSLSDKLPSLRESELERDLSEMRDKLREEKSRAERSERKLAELREVESVLEGTRSELEETQAALREADIKAETLESTLEQKEEKLTRAIAEIHRRAPVPSFTASESGASAREQASGKGRNSSVPFILVLIDGSSAPFADALLQDGRQGGAQAASQIRWEIEKDIRAYNVQIDHDEDESEAPIVYAYVWINRRRLVVALKAGVIRNESKFDDFFEAFNDTPETNMLDIGESPVESKAAAILSTFGPLQACKRIYCVGIHPKALETACPNLIPRTAAEQTIGAKRMTRVIPKLVLVNHRETESDRVELMKSGWRVTVWARFFSVNGGLGGDWGFSYDSNNDEADDDVASSEGEDWETVRNKNANYKAAKQSSLNKGAIPKRRW